MPENCFCRYLISNGAIKEVTMRILYTQTPEYVAHDMKRFIQKPTGI